VFLFFRGSLKGIGGEHYIEICSPALDKLNEGFDAYN